MVARGADQLALPDRADRAQFVGDVLPLIRERRQGGHRDSRRCRAVRARSPARRTRPPRRWTQPTARRSRRWPIGGAVDSSRRCSARSASLVTRAAVGPSGPGGGRGREYRGRRPAGRAREFDRTASGDGRRLRAGRFSTVGLRGWKVCETGRRPPSPDPDNAGEGSPPCGSPSARTAMLRGAISDEGPRLKTLPRWPSPEQGGGSHDLACRASSSREVVAAASCRTRSVRPSDRVRSAHAVRQDQALRQAHSTSIMAGLWRAADSPAILRTPVKSPPAVPRGNGRGSAHRP